MTSKKIQKQLGIRINISDQTIRRYFKSIADTLETWYREDSVPSDEIEVLIDDISRLAVAAVEYERDRMERLSY